MSLFELPEPEERKRQRKPNLAWDALVEVTGANPKADDGRIAKALKGIRDCFVDHEGFLEEDLPDEIRRRAEMYHQMFPGLTLTPMALAIHWIRVIPKKSKMEEAWQRWKDL